MMLFSAVMMSPKILTPEQRLSFFPLAAVVSVLLSFAAIEGTWIVCVTLAASYALLLLWAPLLRFFVNGRSVAPMTLLYGLRGIEVFVAGMAVAVLGPVSPALVIVAMSSMRLTATWGLTGAFLMVFIAVVSGLWSAVTIGDLAGSVTLIGASFGVAAATFHLLKGEELLSNGFFNQGTDPIAGVRAQRVLAGIAAISDAEDKDERNASLATSLVSVTGYEGAVIYERKSGSERLDLSSTFMPSGVRDAPVSAGGEVLSAVQRGCAGALGHVGVGDPVPHWALESGFNIGISAPIFRHGTVLGAVLVFRRDGEVSIDDLESVEEVLRLASRFMDHIPGSQSPRRDNQLGRVLQEAGRQVNTRERQPLEAGEVMLDPSRERALVGGLAIALSRTEFSLLYSLTSAAGEIVAQESLAVDGWGNRGKSGLDVAMSRLRKKLAEVPGGRGLIETVRGRGYRLSLSSIDSTASTGFGNVAVSGAD